MHMATLEVPMHVLGPPELVEATRLLGSRLVDALGDRG